LFEDSDLLGQCRFDVFHGVVCFAMPVNCDRSKGKRRLYEVWVGQERRFVAGEKAFEQDRGGDLVDEVFAVDGFAMTAACGAGVMAGGVKQSVGLLGSVALVEQMVGERGMRFSEGSGEGLCFGGLRAGCAVCVERVSDDEDFDAVLADEAGDGFEVGTERSAVDREERLRDQAERVGDGETDAAVANVEREDAGRLLHAQE
jgi:hypothetical protein